MQTEDGFVVDSGPEGELVELPTLRRLCGGVGQPSSGWTYVHGPALAPDAPAGERAHWSDVVLRNRLQAALARINPQLPGEAISTAADVVIASSSPDIV